MILASKQTVFTVTRRLEGCWHVHVPPSQDISILPAAAQFLSSSALMTQDFDSIIMSYSASASLLYKLSRLISLLVGRLKVSERLFDDEQARSVQIKV